MAQITQNNITFNNVKTAGVEKSAWPLILAGQQGPDSDGGVVNAVDIDWNGAQLGTVNGITLGTINTTGDLMNALKTLAYAISSGGGGTTTRYTVYYETNGGDTIGGQEYEAGATITLPTPTKSVSNSSYRRYKFNGWQVNGTGSVLTGSYTVNSTVTLYASWTLQFNVRLVAYTGTMYTDMWLDAGAQLPTPPSLSGKTFKGWYSDAEYTMPASTVINPQDSGANITSYVTYFAKWEDSSSSTTQYYVYFGATQPTASNLASVTGLFKQQLSAKPSWTSSNPTSFTTTNKVDKCWMALPLAWGDLSIYAQGSPFPSSYSDTDLDTEAALSNITVNGVTYMIRQIALVSSCQYNLYYA